LDLSGNGGWCEEENNIFIGFGKGGIGGIWFVGCAVE
jgi:hypothetical protein